MGEGTELCKDKNRRLSAIVPKKPPQNDCIMNVSKRGVPRGGEGEGAPPFRCFCMHV